MYSTYRFSKRSMSSGIFLILFIVLIFPQAGCNKMVEIKGPTTSISSVNVYNEDATAIAAATGLYVRIVNSLATNMAIVPGVSSDELSLQGGVLSQNSGYVPAYRNALQPVTLGVADFCSTYYGFIFTCNSMLEGLDASTLLTPGVKQQLYGEAYFMRAFSYFYLVNLYGDVPLALTTDYKANTILPRSPKAKVYEQIVADLKKAQELLSDKFLKADLTTFYDAGSEERVRPTKWAATALLARAYLYTEDWVNAEAQATAVINNTTLFQMTTLDKTFLKNNTEAIWQLQPVGNQYFSNTEMARIFVMPDGPNSYNSFYLSPSTLAAFEANDGRKTNWVDTVTVSSVMYYYPFKYKLYLESDPVNEYWSVLRLAEQYLIRAEARAHQNNVVDAADDLDVIRNRAGLPNTTAATQEDLLPAIDNERLAELFTEWGHRWFDLKRRKTIDAVMSVALPQKSGDTWNTNAQLFPFSIDDIKGDHNLVQNPGYN